MKVQMREQMTTFINGEKRVNVIYHRIFTLAKGNRYNIWRNVTFTPLILFGFINLTQVHNFTVSAQDNFTFRRLSVFTVSFTVILQVLMQILKRFIPSY